MAHQVVSSLIRDLIPLFLEHRQDNMVVLQTALDANDFETIRKIAHKMKGSSGVYGFLVLADLAKALEKACVEPNRAEAQAVLNQTKDYLAQLTISYDTQEEGEFSHGHS
ncbi:MAG: Hpt domain-containing protein [Candidatus Margulisiibacteriota bacterium]